MNFFRPYLIFLTNLACFCSVAEAWAAHAPIAVECQRAFGQVISQGYSLRVVKAREDGTKIYELRFQDGDLIFFKEDPQSQDLKYQIFDSQNLAVIATRAGENFGLQKYVAASVRSNHGAEIQDGARIIKTRPGILQKGKASLISPIDEFRKIHPGKEATARDISALLNSGDWPRIYADWKIFWRIFQQVDFNIANLSREGSSLYMFDLGDILNLPATRARMGIATDRQNMNINMPNRPWDLVEHRADFRQADPEFKKLVHDVVKASDEELAQKLGKNLSDSLGPNRGTVRDTVREMRFEAIRLERVLDLGPFDY
jgi:hypothetical protein